MAECLFCSIASHTIPAEVIFEDERSMAILDREPRAPGHTMVIPKRHAATILELPDDSLGPLFTAVKNIADLLSRALKPDGFTIGVNHGRASGQAVDHFHIHVIPRFRGDGGASIHSVVANPPKESLKEIASKIKSAQ